MKALIISMPTSSPRRLQEKTFPPPQPKFLIRINDVGCRSKARASRCPGPVFYIRRRRNASGRMIETAQEPSSPRVSCIGQVRARDQYSRAAALARPRRRISFFSAFHSRRRALRRIFSKWVLFFGAAGDCKNVDNIDEDCFSVGRKIEFSRERCEIFDDGDDYRRAPPMNALMLTRSCRSYKNRHDSENPMNYVQHI